MLLEIRRILEGGDRACTMAALSVRAAVLISLLCFGACRRTSPSYDKSRLRQPQIEPLWQMSNGCPGGVRVQGTQIEVRDRFLSKYYGHTFDTRTGQLLDETHTPVSRIPYPNGKPLSLEGEIVGPLNSKRVTNLLPPGFAAVALTDRLLFARRSWLRVYFHGLLPNPIWHAQVAVIDRATSETIWLLDSTEVTVHYSNKQIYVCDSVETAAFSLTGGRPPEVSAFYAAIRNGDLDGVRRGFPFWQNLKPFDLGGFDPLTLAAWKGQTSIVRFFLEQGFSPNDADGDEGRPLLWAAKGSNLDAAQLLLDAGADPNGWSRRWGIPLTEATHKNGRALVDLLLMNRADVNATSEWGGDTALHEAVMYRNYEAIKALLQHGAEATIVNKMGKTPLELAPYDERVVELFFKHPLPSKAKGSR
jgi:ankyrin repeat protein